MDFLQCDRRLFKHNAQQHVFPLSPLLCFHFAPYLQLLRGLTMISLQRAKAAQVLVHCLVKDRRIFVICQSKSLPTLWYTSWRFAWPILPNTTRVDNHNSFCLWSLSPNFLVNILLAEAKVMDCVILCHLTRSSISPYEVRPTAPWFATLASFCTTIVDPFEGISFLCCRLCAIRDSESWVHRAYSNSVSGVAHGSTRQRSYRIGSDWIWQNSCFSFASYRAYQRPAILGWAWHFYFIALPIHNPW